MLVSGQVEEKTTTILLPIQSGNCQLPLLRIDFSPECELKNVRLVKLAVSDL